MCAVILIKCLPSEFEFELSMLETIERPSFTFFYSNLGRKNKRIGAGCMGGQYFPAVITAGKQPLVLFINNLCKQWRVTCVTINGWTEGLTWYYLTGLFYAIIRRQLACFTQLYAIKWLVLRNYMPSSGLFYAIISRQLACFTQLYAIKWLVLRNYKPSSGLFYAIICHQVACFTQLYAVKWLVLRNYKPSTGLFYAIICHQVACFTQL